MESFLQSKLWAEFKHSQGWQPLKIADFFGLLRTLPLGIRLLYLPELGLAPSQLKGASLRLKGLLSEVKELAKKENLSFARIEFLEEFDEGDIRTLARADRLLKRLGLQKSPEEMQPEHRQVIDLTKTEQQLFDEMKPKGRYNIRVAQRHSVVVKAQNSKLKAQSYNSKLKVFYDLYRQSAQRDGFTPRPLSYFEKMATHMTTHMSCYVASLGNQPLAAALTVVWDGRVSYLYGGSSNEHRNVMAANRLHWEIIKAAKQAGMKTYDLLAIAPQDQPNHKFAGLRRFKEQFGGRSVRLLGSYDLIFDRLRYRLFILAEKLRERF